MIALKPLVAACLLYAGAKETPEAEHICLEGTHTVTMKVPTRESSSQLEIYAHRQPGEEGKLTGWARYRCDATLKKDGKETAQTESGLLELTGSLNGDQFRVQVKGNIRQKQNGKDTYTYPFRFYVSGKLIEGKLNRVARPRVPGTALLVTELEVLKRDKLVPRPKEAKVVPQVEEKTGQ